MEYENKYASKGIGGAGLGLGIAGTALGLMAGGLGNVGGLFNANGGCSDDHYVNRYEAAQAAEIARLTNEVKLRDANTYCDGKILDLYRYVDNKFAYVEKEICEQKVYNATLNSSVSCLTSQIAQLASLTKLVVPITSICPEPAVATTA